MSNLTVIDSFTGDNAFLNNFYPNPVAYEDGWHPTNEHAFQAAKTDDPAQRAWVGEAKTPGEAKRRGRQVTLIPHWDTYWRYWTMENLIAVKFAPGTEMAEKLLDTGDAVLIEGNTWHDQVWGDCRCGRAACKPPGMNLLGYMLMRRRDALREG